MLIKLLKSIKLGKYFVKFANFQEFRNFLIVSSFLFFCCSICASGVSRKKSKNVNLIILKLHYDACILRVLLMETLEFFKSLMGITTSYGGVKAYHILTGDPIVFLVIIICKFNNVKVIMQICKNRKSLRIKVNQKLQKCLTETDTEKKATAVYIGLKV